MLSNALPHHPKKSFFLSVFPRKLSDQPNLTFNNDYTKTVNSAKHLGVLIDKQISFKCYTASSLKYLSRSVGVNAKLTFYLLSKSFKAILSFYLLQFFSLSLQLFLAVYSPEIFCLS